MSAIRRTRLSGMAYDEVSLVDAGGNQDAHVVLFKRDTQADSTNRGRNPLSSVNDSPNRKESRHMATEVVQKTKGSRTCADCGSTVGRMDSHCPECGSEDIKKSLIIVRKVETDDSLTEEEIEAALDDMDDEDEDDEDEVEEDGDEDDSDVDKRATTPADEHPGSHAKKRKRKIVIKHADEEDDEDEDDEDDEDEPVVEKAFSPKQQSTVNVQAFSLASELAAEIVKIFDGGVTQDSPVAYESAMTNFNEVMDGAVKGWLSKSFAPDGEITKKAEVVRQQITSIIKNATEGGVMPQIDRPTALDTLDLPADVNKYISGLEEASGVDDKSDIFKGLNPEVAAIVRKAQETNETAEVAKWEGVAKSFDALPGDQAELAKTLRVLHDTDPAAYETLRKSLEGANAAAKRGDITKVHGRPGGGEPTDAITKRRNEAKELVEKGLFKTIEQAEVALLSADPSDYGKN